MLQKVFLGIPISQFTDCTDQTILIVNISNCFILSFVKQNNIKNLPFLCLFCWIFRSCFTSQFFTFLLISVSFCSLQICFSQRTLYRWLKYPCNSTLTTSFWLFYDSRCFPFPDCLCYLKAVCLLLILTFLYLLTTLASVSPFPV